VKVVGLVTSWREGTLVQGAVRSALAACDVVVCFDGPAGVDTGVGEMSDFSPWMSSRGHVRESHLILRSGEWASDAAKRTAMVSYAHRWSDHAPVWGVWVDGDEVLLWGEYLRDYLIRIGEGEAAAPAEGARGGMVLKLADMDGQVWNCYAKVIRVDLVEAILESSYQVKFFGSDAVLALPNELASVAPLQGEPHLLHRSMLRPPGRDSQRLHKREPDWYERTAREQGLPDAITDELFQVQR
jgi:hypothetical protein